MRTLAACVPLWGLTACISGPAPSPSPPAPNPPAVEEALPAPAPLPEPTEDRYAATHVLIQYRGAVGAPPGVTRTQDEARHLAEQLHEAARNGADLAELARQHSDGPSAPRGGGLGAYRTGTMIPDFEKAVASVDIGELAPLVESPFGVHVARRDAVAEAHLGHVQVSWSGSHGTSTDRSRNEARQRAEAARTALVAGEPLAGVAARFSDDPTAVANGGDLGSVGAGQLVPAFETAGFALAPSEISPVVETRYGFHVIVRID